MALRRALLAMAMAMAMAEGAREMGPKAELPDDGLFRDPAAFCDGCYGVVQELDKLLTKWQEEKGSVEEHIDAALLATCNTDRLRSYVLSPPKMMRLCSGIRAHYEDQLGMALLQHYTKAKIPSVDTLFNNICRKAIPACPKGVRPMTLVRKEKMEKTTAEKETENKKEKKTKQKKDKSDSKKKTTKKDEL